MNDGVIERLGELLERDEPVLLSGEERALVRAALTALAEGERRAGHLEDLLRVHAGALNEAERHASGIEALPAVGVAYDFAAAEAAREAFRGKLEGARTAAGVVSAALTFARDAAVLAS